MTVVTDALATNSKGTSIDVINLSYSVKSGEKVISNSLIYLIVIYLFCSDILD